MIISGRDTEQLAARLPLTGLTFVGNHGLEERHDGASRLLPEANAFLEALDRATAAAAQLEEARIPGVAIERKRAALSVHYRNAPDPAATGSALGAALQGIASGERLRLQAGRLVWELRPAVDINKGAVVRRLVASLKPSGIVYAGDDLTDADAFASLKGMRDVRTLAVGVRSVEVPDAVFRDCDTVVDGVAGMTRLLHELADWAVAAHPQQGPPV